MLEAKDLIEINWNIRKEMNISQDFQKILSNLNFCILTIELNYSKNRE